MNTPVNSSLTIEVLHRICAEYAEMPGLRVTPQQAQRLWGLDEPTCLQALQCLVDAGFLSKTPAGLYMRLTEGHTLIPALRMAKAALPSTAGVRVVG